MTAAELRVVAKQTLQFGFIANPTYSTNLNVSLPLLCHAILVLSPCPTNGACHNLCTHSSLPQNFQALLGLSLKFCIHPKYTQHNKNFSTLHHTFCASFICKCTLPMGVNVLCQISFLLTLLGCHPKHTSQSPFPSIPPSFSWHFNLLLSLVTMTPPPPPTSHTSN